MNVKNEYTSNNKAFLIKGGKEYFEKLFYMIDHAKKSIQIQSYIINEDNTGKLFAEYLKKAALRNIAIFVMADGYASQGLSNSFIKSLKRNGIHFSYFEPVFKSRNFYFGRRLHHKIVVVDSYFAMVGGVNIADRYNDFPDKKAWLDFAIYVEGETAAILCNECRLLWEKYSTDGIGLDCNLLLPDIDVKFKTEIRVRRNDWVNHQNQISATYIEMFRNSKSHITILCSYFLPGKVIRRLILNAVKRGVKITIVAAGPTDIMIAKSAERWLYDWLLRNGIGLFEYKTNVLHGKIATSDDKWMTIGSYNINNISAYASMELNLDVRDERFSKNTRLVIESIIKNECIQITGETHRKRKNLLIQFSRWCSYQIIRIIFSLFTFYFKSNHKLER